MKRIYLVLGVYDNEGSYPLKAFVDKEKANTFKREIEQGKYPEISDCDYSSIRVEAIRLVYWQIDGIELNCYMETYPKTWRKTAYEKACLWNAIKNSASSLYNQGAKTQNLANLNAALDDIKKLVKLLERALVADAIDKIR